MSKPDVIARALAHPSRATHPIVSYLRRCRVLQLAPRDVNSWCAASFVLPSNDAADLPLVLDALSILSLADLLAVDGASAASISLSVLVSAFDKVDLAGELLVEMRLSVIEKSGFIIAMDIQRVGASTTNLGSAEHIVWRLPPNRTGSSSSVDAGGSSIVVHGVPRLVVSKRDASSFRVRVASTSSAESMPAAQNESAMPLLNLRKAMYGGAVATVAADFARKHCSAVSVAASLISVAARYMRPVPCDADVEVVVQPQKNVGAVRFFCVSFTDSAGLTLAQVDVVMCVKKAKL